MTMKRDMAERRKQRLLERIGTPNFACITCGGTEWYTAEGHHIAGRHYDKHVEYFCANCHRRLSEMQKSHPLPTSKTPGRVECAGHYCLGLADVLSLTSRPLSNFGHELLEGVEGAPNGEATRSLTLKAGHFLIVLGTILEEVAPHLEEHGKRLCDVSVQSAEYARSTRRPRDPATKPRRRR
jgi:hypothetical protein